MRLIESMRRIVGAQRERPVDPTIIEAIFGNVSPENIKRKADAYTDLVYERRVGDVERDQWLADHSSGMMEQALIILGSVSQQSGKSLANLVESLQILQSRENTAQLVSDFRDTVPGMIEALQDLSRLETMQFETLAEEVSQIRAQLTPNPPER